MTAISIRRLTDATIRKYENIVLSGGELTPRQKRLLLGHHLITNEAWVKSVLRPDLDTARVVKVPTDTQESNAVN